MDVLDTRDLEEELTALEEPCKAWAALTAEQEEARQDEYPGLEAISRYGELCELREALDGCGWEYGIQLIPVRDFTEYAQELAEATHPAFWDAGHPDTPMMGNERLIDSWPLNCIDWEAAARELRRDYTPIRFDGADYYWREA